MNSMQANLCLICVTLCWSTEVIIFANIPESVPPFATTCITSMIGAVLLILCFFKRITAEIRKHKQKLLIKCIWLGILNMSYNVLYLYGLKFFDVSTGAFTLSMTAVILPVILLTMRQKVSFKTWASAALVFAGIFLAVGQTASIGQIWGVVMVGIGCIIRAFYIVLLNKYARENDPVVISAFISLIVGILSFIPWFVTEPSTFAGIPWKTDVIASMAIYSYFVVAFAQTLNIFAQRRSTPANATIIYSLEIAFSVVWGILLPANIVDQVEMTPWIMFGVLLVIAGNIIEIIPDGRGKIREAEN